ncbi:Phospholipase D1 [Tulasnella sp. JGI-2019a]|nr:Phospholipase D1 [Tulasnella sp. JGI-2019a]
MAKLEELVEMVHHHQDPNHAGSPSANGHAEPPNENAPSPLRTAREPHYLAPSTPSSPMRRPGTGKLTQSSLPREQEDEATDPLASEFRRTDSTFRGAWSYKDRDAESTLPTRKDSKRRLSWTGDHHPGTPGPSNEEPGLWKTWVAIPLGLVEAEPPAETEEHRTVSPEPLEDTAGAAASNGDAALHANREPKAGTSSRQGSVGGWPFPDPLKLIGLTRTKSAPHMVDSRRNSEQGTDETAPNIFRTATTHIEVTPETPVSTNRGWTVLKNRLRQGSHIGFGKQDKKRPAFQPSTAAEIDISEELMAGPLAVLALRMHFERDEDNHRRVPVFLQHLKIRVSDSVHPLHGTHAVFRIECEYGDGAARWVIYRELRDFLSLHTHYTITNATTYGRAGVELPEFPRTSLPLFNILKKEGREKGSEIGKAEFARQQRESLENYLIGLIKAVMFRPEANRLCRWFEISALSVQLATRGGIQGKAGLLRVMSSNSARKGVHTVNLTGWFQKHAAKWWIVRESYLVAVADPSELTVDDVFLLDQDFSIERPKRYYRQGLNLLHIGENHHEDGDRDRKMLKQAGDWDETKRVEKRVEGTTASKFWSLKKKSGEGVKELEGKAPPPPDEAERGKKDGETGDEKLAAKNDAKADAVRKEKGKGSESHDQHDDGDDDTKAHGIDGNIRAPNEPGITDGACEKNPNHRTANADGTNVADVPDDHGRFGAGGGDPEISSDEDGEHHPIIDPSIGRDPRKVDTQQGKEKKKSSKDVSQHTFYVRNTQRKVKFVAKNERQMLQFIASLERMAAQSHWTGNNRFASFAPIRLNVSAQWLVDGRDYMWNLSRALMLAKDKIYIHDWWLSPEVQMRRPGKDIYRLDRLLQRKAQQGVKIFVILYKEVSNRTTPTDSNYTKRRLMALHPNILVQRSPSHFSTGTYYWAHHEKMCVIDETIAFMGGVDLCFGRWDTSQHILTDEGESNGKDGSAQIWHGKDYSNARVSDFHDLDKPDEDMYDRSKVPRMPWHDIGVQIVGQPARDLCRHFIQRWNYLLRTKTHTRVMPFLLPAPDFKIAELEDQALTGSCEVQICRSAGPWSLGTTTRIEHSIQNAYLKAIELSEHFVYIENQFFVTSTVVNDVPVENNIGDALVHRAIRAHRTGTKWRAVIVIPLLPGFTFPIDHNDASAIRLIVELQNRSICRGPHSIFSRLRKEGIDPNDYITFFSLRGWGKLESGTLTTEMVYIHAKIMIVDDRLAIIGSANINERSMRGDRDSELACVIRDTDMIDGRMGGQPFKVGRFAHSMRVRLMREHVGVDTDAMYEEDLLASKPQASMDDIKVFDPDREQGAGKAEGITKVKHHGTVNNYLANAKDVAEQGAYGVAEVMAKTAGSLAKHNKVTPNASIGVKQKAQEQEKRVFGSDGSSQPGFASSKAPTMEERTIAEHRPKEGEKGSDPPLMDVIDEGNEPQGGEAVPEAATMDGELFGAPADAAPSAQVDDRPPNDQPGQMEASEAERAAVEARKRIRQHLSVKTGNKPFTIPAPAAEIDPYGFEDPLDDGFFKDTWMTTAVHNTEIYRKVFHCTPDDMVTTWKQYKEFLQFQERLNRPPKDAPQNAPVIARVPSEGGTAGEEVGVPNTHPDGKMDPNLSVAADEHVSPPRAKSPAESDISNTKSGLAPSNSRRSATDGSQGEHRRRRATNFDEPLEQWERDEFEMLLEGVRGHLVVFPTRFLEGEDTSNNFLFNSDRLLPMPIYN